MKCSNMDCDLTDGMHAKCGDTLTCSQRKPIERLFPPVLDACCSKRAFWFDPRDERALFVDNRSETIVRNDSSNRKGFRVLEIAPDKVADFTALPFPSDTFAHVVFDPPHMTTLGQNSYMAKCYGRLTGDWREMLRKGFAECFRVLRPEGTLIFKWCEYDVPVAEVLALTPEKPLYGHRSGKRSKTHWIAFLKPNPRVDGTADEQAKKEQGT